MPDEKLQLSRKERYYLSNQLRILEALYPAEASDFATKREIIERGYEYLYDEGMDNIFKDDDCMSVEQSSEVWDTLDMYDAINIAIERFKLIDKVSELNARFPGYDGNNESKFMAFAAFTVERLKRWEYLPRERPGNWNSHMPMRDMYRRMLTEWKKIPRQRRLDLTEIELHSILDASTHPDSR
jgi:uncharacterized protein YfbU (UPF0304 family)